MSVLLETSLGDLVIDLDTEECPQSSFNFLKLCAKHYYKFNAFFTVTKDFLAQTGDPTDTGKGGSCIWSQLPLSSTDRVSHHYFRPEVSVDRRHVSKGTVSFACSKLASSVEGNDLQPDLIAASQFFLTLTDKIDYLDRKHAPFGTVVEGQEQGGTLDKINAAFVDAQQCPLKDIRIRHIVVLEDPFPDPDGFTPPSRSPSPTPQQMRALRLADDDDDDDERLGEKKPEEEEETRRLADTNAAALTLEMVGDLPFAEIRPPENILFVCKLNPVTRSDDLQLLFSRFGTILSCQVIKDKRTGDSLQYAFIEFDKKEDAERAYFKMQNVLIDDRRIWVDFSQSVSQLHSNWIHTRTGAKPTPPSHGTGTRNDRDHARHHNSKDARNARDTNEYTRRNGSRDGRDDRRSNSIRDERDYKRSRYDHERDGSRSSTYTRDEPSRRKESSRAHDRRDRHRYHDEDRERERERDRHRRQR